MAGVVIRFRSDIHINRVTGDIRGLVFQAFNLCPHLDVRENMAPCTDRIEKRWCIKKALLKKQAGLLERVGLA